MSGNRLVQQKNGATTTIEILGGDVEVRYLGKKKGSHHRQSYRLTDLHGRANRVAGTDKILTGQGWIVLLLSVGILFPGLRALQTPSLLDNEEALAHSIIFTLGGLVGIGAMLREIVLRRKNSSGSFVFSHINTRQPLFAFLVDEPSEEEATEFCERLEKEIEAGHDSLGNCDEQRLSDSGTIAHELENLCVLFERGVLTEPEFSKAKNLLLQGS